MSWSNYQESQVQVPNLCARCGEKPRDTVFQVTQNRTTLGLLGRRRRITTNYPVGLCTDCDTKVKGRIRTGQIIAVLGLLFIVPAAAGLVYLGYKDPTAYSHFGSNPLQIVALAALVIGLLISFIGSRVMNVGFGKYNGKHFNFRNKAYQQAFAEANPTLVRQKR